MFNYNKFNVFCRLNLSGARTVATMGVLLAAAAIVGQCQSTSGTILGAVKDPSGNLVSSARVQLTNQGTNAIRTTLTNDTGSYEFTNVEIGAYQLIVEAPGFQKVEFTAFNIGARETKRLDSDLKVASQATTVNVESSAGALVQTDTSNVAETKSGRELVDLPVAIATRGTGSTSAMSTLTTQPSVQTDDSGGISVAGAMPTQLSITIDGLSVIGARTDGPLTELFPSFNAIEEIRVSEVINPAEFGGVADISTISKSGTNSVHGGVFENLQNSYMNAGNTFTHTTPSLKMNDFGAFFGGPIVIPKLYNGHDKTFFFGSYEGLQLPRQVAQIESVPSLALRNGNLSGYTGALTGYPGNIIPVSQISSLSEKALQYLFPAPNRGAPGAISNNYTAYFPEPIKSNQADLRIDQQLTSKQQTYVRFTYKNRRVETTPTGSALLGPFSQPEIDYAIAAAHNYVISPTVINELRGGVSGNHSASSYAITATQAASEMGLTNLPGPIPAGDAVPNFSIVGFQTTGGAGSSLSANKTIQLLDTLTWTKEKHTLKFGADYRYLTGLYTNVFSSRRLGQYTFNSSVMSALLGSGAGTPFASFLLGYPDTSNIATVIAPDTHGYASHYGFFAQDDWKVTQHLTINFGMRYEYHPMFLDHLSNTTNFLPTVSTVVNGVTVNGAAIIPNQYAFSILNQGFAESIYPTPVLTAAQAGIPESLRYSGKTDFAPRIGFAWRPFNGDKTVIRGGYGRFVEALLGSAISSSWGVSASDVASFNNSIGSNGLPAYTFPNPYPADIAVPGSQSFYQAFNAHYLDPFVDEWDLTVEQNLGRGVSLRIAYDGNHGSNLGLKENLNEVPVNTVGFATASKSAPFPIWNYIAYQNSIGVSNYNSMTAAFTKRFSSGLQFEGSYVWAKNLADNAGYDPTAFSGEAGGTITNRFAPSLDYGNVAYTHRNRVLVTYLYELPLGKGKAFLNRGGLVNSLVGGWEMAGVVLAETGPYMTMLASGDPSGTGFNQLVGIGRADTVSGVSPTAGQSISQWVNPAAFAIPKNNIGRFADSAVGAVEGPGTAAVSMSLIKSIPFTEKARMQVGASVANLFNHPNYAIPSNLTVGTSGFGSLNGLETAEGAGPRAIQLTARISF